MPFLSSIGISALNIIRGGGAAGGGLPLLLDEYPAILAPSVRKISSTYSGNDMNVRAATTGSPEQEIGYTDNDLDTTSLLAHTGANDGFVVTWFDPSGNGYDFSQVSAGRQAQIVDAGSVITAGTQPTLSFVSGGMATSSAVALGGATELWLFMVLNITNVTTTQVIYETSPTNVINAGSFILSMSGGNMFIGQKSGSNRVLLRTPAQTGLQVLTIRYKSNESDLDSTEVWFNGNIQTLDIQTSGNSPTTYTDYKHYLGARNETDLPFLGDISEAILMTGDQSSNRGAIETNINSYYVIYPDVAVSGLLFDYPNAAAAYSVRQLMLYSNGYKETLVRVRRSSDNAEVDVKADSNYEISLNSDTSSGLSLGDWIGSDDGFVTTWYDQSGNGNNATQSTASAQPQIVSGGSYLGYLQTMPVNDNMDTPYSYIVNTDYSCFSVFQNNGNCCIGGTNSTSHFYGLGQENNIINPSLQFFNLPNYYKNSNVIGITRDDIYNETLSFALFSLLVKSSSNLNLGIGYPHSAFANSRFKEYILYPNQTVSRTGIETNINAQYNMYWDGSQTSLLDDYSGAVAGYSLRALSSSYTGPLIRVRRSSDNAEQDVYAKYDGSLNTTALEDFCAATDGFVVTWYDQSGNTNDAVQTTAASQPQIVSSGSVLMQNNKPQIQNGYNKDLLTSYSLSNKTFWIFGAISTYENLMVYIGTAGGSSNFLYAIDTTSTLYNKNASITTQYLNGSIINPLTRDDLYNLFETNTSRPLKLSSINATFAYNFGVLNFGFGSGLNGLLNMSEVIFYPSDQSSNRTGIESNINDYYNIY